MVLTSSPHRTLRSGVKGQVFHRAYVGYGDLASGLQFILEIIRIGVGQEKGCGM